MHLVFRKALWAGEIMVFSFGASLSDMILVISFVKECTRLIGLKCPTSEGFAFLGMRVTEAVFSRSKSLV